MRYVIALLALCLAACETTATTVDATELGGVATWNDSPYPTSAVAKANAH